VTMDYFAMVSNHVMDMDVYHRLYHHVMMGIFARKIYAMKETKHVHTFQFLDVARRIPIATMVYFAMEKRYAPTMSV